MMQDKDIPPHSLEIDGDETRVDTRNGVLLFGSDTEAAKRFNVIANHCARTAERVGLGPDDLAGILVQLAAYYLGSEYDDAARRNLLATECLRVLFVKAERAVGEVEKTGFRLSPGTLDLTQGRYVNHQGEVRYDKTSPVASIFSLLGRDIRDYARSIGAPPAYVASDLMVIAGYHIGSNHSDPVWRQKWLDAVSTAFRRYLLQAPFQGELDRAAMSDMAPAAGWRGGTDYHEADARRGHPELWWLRDVLDVRSDQNGAAPA